MDWAGVVDPVVLALSCTVEETDRPSRDGGAVPPETPSPSSDVSSSSSGADLVPFTGSVDEGYWRNGLISNRHRSIIQAEIESEL